MDDILAGLNEAQRCAVSSPASVLQVLAPPGSGKTKTLTARVAYLMNHVGIKPWNIIVCTFTIKAAREMKERIRGFVGDGTEAKLILGTFHSVARRFLVYYGHHIGIEKNFGIADSSDTLAILKRIIKRHDYGIEPSVARSRISGLKAKSISCEQHRTTTKAMEQQEFATVYSDYEETLKSSNLLDYDDLLLRCVDLLRSRPECVSNIEAVLIDEFQDTNHVQYDLMRLMAQKRSNITIVGDPDQSIYGFRSAEIKNLRTMQKHYPETVVVILEENYRSSAAILQSALEVIEQDENRPAKKLLPTHCAGEIPVLRKLPSATIEATWIVEEIQRANALTGKLLTYSDFAILLRSAALSRQIETALAKSGIPYRMVGGLRFFDRVEVKLLLDYLRVINRPDHNDAVARIINTPSRKVGEVTVRSLLEEAEERKTTLWSLVLGAAQGSRRLRTKLSSSAEKGIQSFVNVILTSQKKLSSKEGQQYSLLDLIDHVMKKISFEEYLKKTHPEDFEGRWANVQELIAQATDAALLEADALDMVEEALPQIEDIDQRELSSTEDTLAAFLANVSLSTEVQQEEGTETDQVTISTIHAAKGLEWPVVFIPAAYNGSIPHSRAEDQDEERRLLYVGMTRAQSLLYLSCPIKNTKREETVLSSFLSHKRMKRFFGAQGPIFGYNATQDLARILRRACPTPEVCNETRSLIERPEDNHYPLDGEDPEQETSTSYSAEFPSNGYTKRRRLNDAVPADLSGTGIAVTMQQPEKFTMSNFSNPGFVSAGARMREIQETAEHNAALRAEQNERHRSSIAQLKRESSKKESASGEPKRPPGQNSITSFFGRPAPDTEQDSAPLPSFQRPATLSSLRTIIPTPTSTLSTNTTNHRLLTKPLHTRPSRPAYAYAYPATGAHSATAAVTKPYSFMSSSPPPPLPSEAEAEDNNNNNNNNDDDDGGNDNGARELASSPPPLPPPPGSEPETEMGAEPEQPAHSLHNMTMARVTMQQQQQGQGPQQRRTLGMRRSVRGWGGGGSGGGIRGVGGSGSSGGFMNKPFVAPGRRR
ncbi:uncharacterized protein K452DRAFT_272677 [Aplosporella prunicola CBS 121167]|uniref:DNA 3'-5' helicase n=1 Tax=Aplosporella prunicola CBS 121167 TaxID=1176127 RepID=A0A6A6BCF0_9PEZI|nr:uncharacterized protein K452DRAFT_272677 [Aplosporella prunicola CBS 121167]KAF2140945.1 hypothetical protein K452DRAFT_272677 [Aplosporella prunicola CBS 121167]